MKHGDGDYVMGIIRTTYEIITEESAKEGEIAERGFLEDKELGVKSIYTVEEAVELLRGCEPSSTQFHSGVWYTQYGEMDSLTGEVENLSYHLVRDEWTEEEERFIYEQVCGKR